MEMSDYIKVPDKFEVRCEKCKEPTKWASKHLLCPDCDRSEQERKKGFSIQTFY